MLHMEYLTELEEYITSGRLAEDFSNSPEERRFEILDFLEKLMDVAEAADKVATEVIFKDSMLSMMSGTSPSEK
ncbi:MAG: hypothetical protein AB7E47_10245 [Desulfovibrionaceae bacterium]